jgi:hypothetical protein
MRYLEKEFGISLALKERRYSDDEEDYVSNKKKESFRLPELPNLNSRNTLPLALT